MQWREQVPWRLQWQAPYPAPWWAAFFLQAPVLLYASAIPQVRSVSVRRLRRHPMAGSWPRQSWAGARAGWWQVKSLFPRR